MAPNDKKCDAKEVFPVNGDRKTGCSDMPDDMLCGIGPCKVGCMQVCARMGVFVGVYSLSGLITSVLSMYIVSQITTIEKQFGLNSSQSGFLLSCNDIGFLLTTLLASYFARKVHIPRVLWFTVVMYGIAGIVCSMAYFVSRDFSLEQGKRVTGMITSGDRPGNGSTTAFLSPQQTPLCAINLGNPSDEYVLPGVNNSKCGKSGMETSFGVGEPNSYTKLAMTFIAVGMIIQGVAKAPRYPFLTTYIDDNVKKKNTAMYMGIISGIGIFGPAVAFSVGGLFSRQYVTLQDVPISPRHPAWIGAWWLGFIVFGALSVVISLPLLCFPRRFRARPPRNKSLPAEKQVHSTTHAALGFFKSLLRLLSNGVYMPLVVSTCFTLFGVAGMVSFSAKYIETQFFIPAWKANMLLGAMNIVAASAGTMVGGIVVTKKKLSPLACVKMLLVIGVLAIILHSMLYLLGCANADISGFNYKSIMPETGSNETCGAMCGCDNTTFFPVCGSDNNNYMSPCHAGCINRENITYTGCSCIGMNATAAPGLCETSCVMLYPYLINNIFGAFLGTLGMMPGFIVMLRSVSEVDKPMAVGVSSLLATICGWFAGPIIFGMVIDTTCQLWTQSCSGPGACGLYDNDDFRIKFISLNLAVRVVVIVIHVFVFFKARSKTNWSLQETNDTKDDNEASTAMIKSTDTELVTRDPIYKGETRIT